MEQAEDPLEYESAFDIVEYLRDLPAFTFALVGDYADESGPTLASVVQMIECFATDRECKGPYPGSLFFDDGREAEARQVAIEGREYIIKEVQEQIAKLRQSGKSFALLWRAYGEQKARFDDSEGNSDWDDDVIKWLACHAQEKLMRFAS